MFNRVHIISMLFILGGDVMPNIKSAIKRVKINEKEKCTKHND